MPVLSTPPHRPGVGWRSCNYEGRPIGVERPFMAALVADASKRASARQRLISRRQKNLLARNLDRRRHREKLLSLGGSLECCDRRNSAAYNLRHQIEISRADEALVFCAFVSHRLTCKFSLLQLRISLHAGFFVALRQVEHAQIKGVESSEGYELELVTHCPQLFLEARNRGLIELLLPVE